MTFDANVLRFNQLVIVSGLALAMVFNQPLLVAFIGGVLLLGSVHPALALFKRSYLNFVRPALRLKPDPVDEDPRPHNFAQGVGGAFLALATLFFVVGAPPIGWGLAVIVVALALLNLTTRFCAGCFLYYQFRVMQRRLNRI
jgi:Domain of unknown function (DUF4395)